MRLVAIRNGGDGGGDGGYCGANPMHDDDEDEAEAWSRLLCPDAALEAEGRQTDASSSHGGGSGSGGSSSAGLGCSGMRPEDLIEWLRSRTEVRTAPQATTACMPLLPDSPSRIIAPAVSQPPPPCRP
jgi:hypothetical protein